MNDKDYATTIAVNQTPEVVFSAVNNPRGWWSEEIEGDTDKLGAEFTYHYKDIHGCKMKITEFIPDKKVVWTVLDNSFDFTKEESAPISPSLYAKKFNTKTEWKGTKVTFEITRKGNETEIRFSHLGLVPEYECYDLCSNAWGSYINGSLKNLITKGIGSPNRKEK
jgi:hypothetical protein